MDRVFIQLRFRKFDAEADTGCEVDFPCAQVERLLRQIAGELCRADHFRNGIHMWISASKLQFTCSFNTRTNAVANDDFDACGFRYVDDACLLYTSPSPR